MTEQKENPNLIPPPGESTSTSLVRFGDPKDADVPTLDYKLPAPVSYEGRLIMDLELGSLPWNDDAYKGKVPPPLPSGNEGDSEIKSTMEGINDLDMATISEYIILPSQLHLPQASLDEGAGIWSCGNLEIPLSEIMAQIKRKMIMLVYENFGGTLGYAFTPAPEPGQALDSDANPRFQIIEHYRLTSFFGNYGAGRTVKTFSLWPGEETSLYVRSWRRTEQRLKAASTIFDSYNVTAAQEFETSLDQESSRRVTSEKKAKLKAKVGGVFKCFSGSVGGSVSSRTTRDRFAKTVAKATTKHASEASAKRETTISTEIESSEIAEFETITERTVKNINLSRVLNLVCRELNQEFDTYLTLVDVSVAFDNDLISEETGEFVFDHVPLHDIDRLIRKYVKAQWGPGDQPSDRSSAYPLYDLILQETERQYGLQILDSRISDNLRERIENYRRDPRQSDYEKVIEDMANEEGLDEDDKAAIAEILRKYTFKPPEYVKERILQEITTIRDRWGEEHTFIEQPKDKNGVIIDENWWRVRRSEDPDSPNPFHPRLTVPVEGIIIEKNRQVIRTDGVVIDALLGHGVALDSYALGTQQEVLRERQLNNKMMELALEIVEKGDKNKLSAFREIFGPHTEDLLSKLVKRIRGSADSLTASEG
ncbi:MAG: hypothetical protein ACYTEQ_17960 [Planctomycetota bacterium]|jgi:hypothetical protein